jgi:hypothetical protein
MVDQERAREAPRPGEFGRPPPYVTGCCH